jgi:DnaJ-class molecular chaperone
MFQRRHKPTEYQDIGQTRRRGGRIHSEIEWACIRTVTLTADINAAGRGGKKGAVEQCPTCRGTGMQVQIQQLGPGMIQQIQSMCGECRGQGERINPKDRCKSCQGKKVRVHSLQSTVCKVMSV